MVDDGKCRRALGSRRPLASSRFCHVSAIQRVPESAMWPWCSWPLHPEQFVVYGSAQVADVAAPVMGKTEPEKAHGVL